VSGDLRARFRAFAGRPGRLTFAPGRVNLIGEHTDYTGGFVLPASLAIGVRVSAASRDDRTVRVLSEALGQQATFALDVLPRQARGEWSDYVAGVVWSLQRCGVPLRGADLLIASEIPMGAGLSSSAALEVAAAHALLEVAGHELPPLALARACQAAENQFVGARCGIMDQFIATHGQPGHAVLLDCATHAWRAIPLPATHRWIVSNTRVRHALAHGEYNIRRAECEEIVDAVRRRLPHRSRLADLDAAETEMLGRELPGHLVGRLRHVVSENGRVLDAVAAMEAGDMARLGRTLTASHASLRDDFEVSCRELDVLVAIASELPGVAGARMIGGGFGGCTLTLVEETHVTNLREQLRSNYVQSTGKEPDTYICEFGGAGGVLA
jgi:galactokinase